ncbi:transcriptional regulator SUPERMAN-like [Forsythia ovata]|uniref:Transcriptional regulator SUPERMAN-like n=1 Tax=Forsythia ovata TaxID=205694 RepID=A0ABD1VEH9_9LAMI
MEKLKWDCERFKRKWDTANLSFEKDLTYGFSWPQRNYKCSFCKKEFKSAQALGAPATDQHLQRDNVASLLEGDMGNNLKKGALLRVDDVTGFARRNDPRIWKAKELVKLDLSRGLVQHAKEDLDLELRLGYSN